MATNSNLTLIELINEASAKEKGLKDRPPYWEMVLWWTKRIAIAVYENRRIMLR